MEKKKTPMEKESDSESKGRAILSAGYEEVLALVMHELGKIRSERRLRKWCEDRDLSYSSLVSLLNNTTKRPQPNKLLDLLHELGYPNVEMEKVFLYKFTVEDIARIKKK